MNRRIFQFGAALLVVLAFFALTNTPAALGMQKIPHTWDIKAIRGDEKGSISIGRGNLGFTYVAYGPSTTQQGKTSIFTSRGTPNSDMASDVFPAPSIGKCKIFTTLGHYANKPEFYEGPHTFAVCHWIFGYWIVTQEQ